MAAKANGLKLLTAVSENKVDIAKSLLKEPVDFTVEKGGDNPIHLAARNGHLDLIKTMVSKGATISQKNQNGNTVAHYAAREGNVEILQYVKSLKADLNTYNNDGNTPLHAAVINQPMNVIETLADLGMNPNLPNKNTGETPLHTATMYGRLSAMEGLLLKGALPNVADKHNRKPEDMARKDEIRQAIASYTSLFAALQTGFVQAIGMNITKQSVAKPVQLTRVGVTIKSIDIPKEFPTAFYCRRERTENSTVPLKPKPEEHVFSDVFHLNISNVRRPCLAEIYLPVYAKTPDKEEMIMRFFSKGDEKEDRIIPESEKIGDGYQILLDITLHPETSCICAIYSRPKQENNTVPLDGTVIRSKVEQNFEMNVPAEAFKKDTVLSLKVYDSAESAKKPTDDKAHSHSLATDVFQINIKGNQPNKAVTMQLPTLGDRSIEEMAILTMDERDLEKNVLPEVVPVQPTLVNTNLVFDVSHFCIYVAVPKDSIATEEDLRVIKRQISDVRERRKQASFLAVCKQVQGRHHSLLVECGLEKRFDDRFKKWTEKGYEASEKHRSNTFMFTPGDAFVVSVEGNGRFDNAFNASKLKLTFSQCRSSFQAFSIVLNEDVHDASHATADVILHKQEGSRLEELCRLQVQMHCPPKSSADQFREIQFSFIDPGNCERGTDINVGMMIRNATDEEKTVKVRMTLLAMTSNRVKNLKEDNFETTIEAKTEQQCMMMATPKEYTVEGFEEGGFSFTAHATIIETNEMFVSTEKFKLK